MQGPPPLRHATSARIRGKTERRQRLKERATQTRWGLMELLKSFFGERTLEYKCECQRSTGASQKLAYRTLPRVLMIHIKRFIPNRAMQRYSKSMIHVKFPSILNMRIFCDPRTQAPQEKLDAYAKGGAVGAHATLFAKDRVKWYRLLDVMRRPSDLPVGFLEKSGPLVRKPKRPLDAAQEDPHSEAPEPKRHKSNAPQAKKSLIDLTSVGDEDGGIAQAIAASLVDMGGRTGTQGTVPQTSLHTHTTDAPNPENVPDPDDFVPMDGATELPSGFAVYRLQGIVRHHGAVAFGGHYTAHVMRPCGWEETKPVWESHDDEKVKVVEETEVFGLDSEQKCYVLYYVHHACAAEADLWNGAI